MERKPVQVGITRGSGKIVFGEKIDSVKALGGSRSFHGGADPFMNFSMSVGHGKACRAIVISGGGVGDIRGGIGWESAGIVDTVGVFIQVDPSLGRPRNEQVRQFYGAFVDGEIVRSTGCVALAGRPTVALADVDVAREAAATG